MSDKNFMTAILKANQNRFIILEFKKMINFDGSALAHYFIFQILKLNTQKGYTVKWTVLVS
jgi:hypothetical protein